MAEEITAIEQQQESRVAALALARQQAVMLQDNFAEQQDLDNTENVAQGEQEKGMIAGAKKIVGSVKSVFKTFKKEVMNNKMIIFTACVFEPLGTIPLVGIAFNWLFGGIVWIYFYIKKSDLSIFESFLLIVVVEIISTILDAFLVGFFPASVVLIIIQLIAIAIVKSYKELKSQLSENFGIEVQEPEGEMA